MLVALLGKGEPKQNGDYFGDDTGSHPRVRVGGNLLKTLARICQYVGLFTRITTSTPHCLVESKVLHHRAELAHSRLVSFFLL